MVESRGIERELVELAWRRLWTPGSKYYLPDIMLNGIDIPGFHLDPLKNLHCNFIGPMPLVEQSTWGALTLLMTDLVLSGLPGVFATGIDYDESTRALTAKIGFGPLRLTGNYRVDASGVAGCAVDIAKALLGARAAVTPRAETESDPELDQARAYRDRLVRSAPGRTLVASYYDNNDIFNLVSRGDNVFNYAWPRRETRGNGPDGQPVTVRSRNLADQTYQATVHENDPAHPVGYNAYSLHSYIMQGLFIRGAQEESERYPDRKKDFDRAIDATMNFASATRPYSGQQTAGNVMKTVESTNFTSLEEAAVAGANAALSFEDEVQREIEATWQEWQAVKAARAGRPAGEPAPNATVVGDFADSMTGIGLTFHATVKVTGTMPDLVLTVTINRIEAAVPRIRVELRSREASALFNFVQNYVANSDWVQSLLQVRIGTTLDSPFLRSYMSERINQALAKFFGAVDFDRLALPDTETDPTLDDDEENDE